MWSDAFLESLPLRSGLCDIADDEAHANAVAHRHGFMPNDSIVALAGSQDETVVANYLARVVAEQKWSVSQRAVQFVASSVANETELSC